jgi:hypothetical protein
MARKVWAGLDSMLSRGQLPVVAHDEEVVAIDPLSLIQDASGGRES